MTAAATDDAGPQPAAQVDVGAFRRAVGRFATGVCVVSTVADGRDHAMTANAFMSVSLDPLLVCVGVERDTRFHDAILDAGAWGVSVLDDRSRRHAEWLATPGRPLVGQLDVVPHHRGRTGVVLADQALSALECRTTAVHPAGDHVLVVGEVVALELPDEVHPPLLYHRSAYRRLA